MVPWAITTIVVLAALAVLLRKPVERSNPVAGRSSIASAQRLVISLPDGVSFDFAQELKLGGLGPSVAISPDGSKVVFAAKKDGRSQLYVRELDSFNVKPLPDTEGGYGPFFSPDSNALTFFTDQGLHLKKRLLTHTSDFLCAAPASVGGTWLSDKSILLATSFGAALRRVEARVGTAQQPVESPHDPQGNAFESTFLMWPESLAGPGGPCLFTDKFKGIGHAALQGENKITWLAPAPCGMARYVSSGHIVFARQGQLFAIAFDRDNVETRGDPVLVLDGLRTGGEFRMGHFDISQNGTLVYIAGTSANLGKLVWVDRTGEEEDIPTGSSDPGQASVNYFDSMHLSPDGTRLASIIWTTQSLWLYDLTGKGPARRLASGVEWPLWSFDSKSVVAVRARGPSTAFTRYDLHGGSEMFVEGRGFLGMDSWSPDGQYVLLTAFGNRNGGVDILVLDTHADTTPRLLFKSAATEWISRFSPNGKWIAYASAQSGLASEIYVRAFPDGDRAYLVSAEGGEDPMWSGDGREVFYRRDNQMWSVKVSFEPTFNSEDPVQLFSGPYLQTHGRSHDYDAKNDRFILVKQVEEEATEAAIRVIFNFDEELKRLVPKR